MAERWYALARWDDTDADEVDAHGRQPGWYPPQGTVGLFDMRPSSATEYGFFALDHKPTKDDWLGTDTPDLHIFNDGTDLREYHMDGAEKDEWRSLLNLSTSDMADSDVDTLEDALIWTFERCGDPEHAQRFKPPTATTAGNIELHLGGHSLISRTPFARLPKAAQDRTLAVVQKDMGRILDLCRMGAGEARRRGIVRPPGDHYRRVATRMMWKYPTVQDWKRLFPQGRRGDVEPPLPPETAYTDNFDRANEPLSDGNWTAPRGTGSWSVESNEVECGGNDGWTFPRYDSALSSDDHYSRLDQVSIASDFYFVAVGCRYPSTSAQTGYTFDVIDKDRLRRWESGSQTTLDQSSNTDPPEPFTHTVEADGSTINTYINGSLIYSLTDTAVSGNLYGGIVGYYGANANHGDNFKTADLGAAPSVSIPAIQQHGNTFVGNN